MAPDELVVRLQRLRKRLKKEKYAPLLEKLESIQVKRQEKDVKAVEALRGRLRMKGLLPPELDDFDNLLRFLKQYRYNVPKTADVWSHYLQWREEYGAEDVLSFDFSERQSAAPYYTFTHHGVDRQGRPCYYEHTGKMDLHGFYKVSSLDRLMRVKVKDAYLTTAARLPACSVAAGRSITGATLVLDMSTLGWKNATSETFAYLRELGQLDNERFPGLAHRVIVINATAFVRYAWSSIRFFFASNTFSKIVILGPHYHNELFKYIDPSQVPEVLGGSCERHSEPGCMHCDWGPWTDADTLRVVHLMRRGVLRVKDPLDVQKLSALGRIHWQPGGFTVDGQSIPEAAIVQGEDDVDVESDDEEEEELDFERIPRKVSFYMDDKSSGNGGVFSFDDMEDSEEGDEREQISFLQQTKIVFTHILCILTLIAEQVLENIKQWVHDTWTAVRSYISDCASHVRDLVYGWLQHVRSIILDYLHQLYLLVCVEVPSQISQLVWRQLQYISCADPDSVKLTSTQLASQSSTAGGEGEEGGEASSEVAGSQQEGEADSLLPGISEISDDGSPSFALDQHDIKRSRTSQMLKSLRRIASGRGSFRASDSVGAVSSVLRSKSKKL